MRLLIDTLVALTLVGVLAGVVYHNRSADRLDALQQLARDEVQRFHQQVILQTALRPQENSVPEFPDSIDPEWFKGEYPRNPLLGPDHPWVEVAHPSQRHLRHPRNRVANNPGVATFWYNPSNGVVRARVPMDMSDARALSLYNFINDSHLRTLFGDE